MNNEEEMEQGRQMAAAHADREYPEPMPDFRFIKAWAQWHKWSEPHLRAELYFAMDQGAPAGAIYFKRDHGEWATIEQIKNPLLKRSIREIANAIAQEEKNRS